MIQSTGFAEPERPWLDPSLLPNKGNFILNARTQNLQLIRMKTYSRLQYEIPNHCARPTFFWRRDFASHSSKKATFLYSGLKYEIFNKYNLKNRLYNIAPMFTYKNNPNIQDDKFLTFGIFLFGKFYGGRGTNMTWRKRVIILQAKKKMWAHSHGLSLSFFFPLSNVSPIFLF